MPTDGSTRSKGKARAKVPLPEPVLSDEEIENACSDDVHGLVCKTIIEAGPVPTGKGTKRDLAAASETPMSFGGEVHNMLSSFGVDISKNLEAKRKKLEGFTEASLKTSKEKVAQMWQMQKSERHKLSEEYQKQVVSVFLQWESDMQKVKEAEEKLQNLFKQHQKLFQQLRVTQTQRLKTIKQLHEQYMKGMESMEQRHLQQTNGMQAELKQEMSLLQKKMLMDTQNQEMAQVRRSLQNMLAQV